MAKISEASFPRASSIPSPSPSQGRATEEEVWDVISLSSLSRDSPDPLSRAANSLSLHNILTSRAAAAAPAADGNTEAAGNSGLIVDPRKKRMMKNRESAARSRARKQAYTDELEKEVENLSKENRRLELKYEKLLKQTLAAGIPAAKKRKIQRTVSAPF